MPKTIWNAVGMSQSVENSAGQKTIGDYSGLYKKSNAIPPATSKQLNKEAANSYFKETERRRLNRGEDFTGYLARRRVGAVDLCIAKHLELGLCAFEDSRLNHYGDSITVSVNGDEESLAMDKAFFFTNLSADPISGAEIDEVCTNYHRRFILVVRKMRLR